MAIIFGNDTGIVQDSFSGFISEISGAWDKFSDDLSAAFSGKLKASGPPPLEKVHVDDGFSNVPGTSFVDSTVDNVDDIQTRRIATQEPSLTVYIKKRAFWGLKSANDARFMDKGDKLFIRASKILFERKCNQIAAYEALTKASSLISEDAHLDSARVTQLIGYLEEFMNDSISYLEADYLSAIKSHLTDIEQNEALRVALNKLKENIETARPILDSLREMQKKQDKLRQATNTTWVVDPDEKDIFNMGRGSGVIELTLVSSIDTSLGLQGMGRVNMTVHDPYNLMKITTDDVETSLAAANAELNAITHGFEVFSPNQFLEEARRIEEKLRDIRENRISEFFGTDRAVIGNSKLPEIIFEINATSYSKQKVVAYTSASEMPGMSLDNLRLNMLQLPIEQQLTLEEGKLVSDIFLQLNSYVTTLSNLNQAIWDANSNKEVMYARRNLRIHYLGKSLIQPMDSIHVYMRGNTAKQGEIIGPLSGLLNNSEFVQLADQDRDVSDSILMEEMEQFGLNALDIDLEFYKSVRSGSFMRNAGLHVFGGVVGSVSESYNASNGTYITNVSGESNLKWLNLSRVNTAPSLDQAQGVLEDPLTPFEFDIDPTTGLLIGARIPNQGNAKAISDGKLKDKSGTNRCKAITSQDDLDQDHIGTEHGVQPVMKHTPGLVYKWKQGVIAVTRDINLARSLSGSEDGTKKAKREVGLKVVDKPFAGLDAADVIGILVTGYPHSNDRFFKAATQVGTYTSGGENADNSYFHSIFDITRSTNKTLGNFKPFRGIKLDGTQLAQQLVFRGSLQQNFSRIDKLRIELARGKDKLRNVIRDGSENTNNKEDEERQHAVRTYFDIVSNIEDKLKEQKRLVEVKRQEAVKGGIIKDNDNIMAVAQGLPIPSEQENETQDANKSAIRLRNKILQLRTQHDCKFNADDNLLIIGDEYDNNISIQAFIAKLLSGDQNMFNSTYEVPLQMCRKVADTINFEFFCDTQGHLQFRLPQYNKIPLSLILKMFMLKERKGTQLYPDFLKGLFEGRLNSAQSDLDTVNDEIYIKGLLLNFSDSEIENITATTIMSDDADDMTRLQYSVEIPDAEDKADKIKQKSDDIANRTGNKSKLQDKSFALQQIEAYNDPSSLDINSLRLKATNDIRGLLSRKQQLENLVKKLENQQQKYSANISAADFDKEKMNNLLAPFKDLIEDDYNDFLGPGSSKRFIIYDEQIISYNFAEDSANAICRVDVTGELNFVGGPGGPVPNMPTIWAGATDFDLWRQYGYRSDGPVNKPFLKHAADQCAPYAMFLLSRARRDVVRGTITVYGNEYYQVGDVVYINSRDSLFYVSDVAHKFSYEGGSFQTTLTLIYGHTLGDYIPTPFDVIGEGLLKIQKKANDTPVERETSSIEIGVHLGLVIFEEEETDNEIRAALTEPYARRNVDSLKRSLLMARNHISSVDPDAYPKIEIRGWYFDEKNKSKVQNRMNAVLDWFEQPVGRWIKSESRFIIIGKQYTEHPLNPDQIQNSGHPFDPINLNEDLEGENKERFRMPNDEVYSAISNEELDPTNIIEIVLIYK